MKKATLTLLGICLFMLSTFSQTTETFETESSGSTSFTDNGQVFNITSQAQGPFDIQASFPGTGWNGTSADNRYIDNDGHAVGSQPVRFTISSSGAVPFLVKSFWLYLSDQNANVAVTGSLTIQGLKGGVSQFTVTASSGFNTNAAVNNGFTQINMTTFGGSNNSNTQIDQLVISTANNFNYVALDAFTWATVALPPSISTQPSGQTVCAGSNTTFGVTASNATGYQWQVNTGSGFTNVSNTAPYSGATSNTLTISGATAGMSGYQYRCVVSGAVAPNATSNAATLTVTSVGQWLGTTSNAWSNTANWGCGTLPVSTTNVTISAGAPNMPAVDITTAICNNITIASGASLTVSAGKTLEIQGAVTNSGTFTASGKAKFSGNGQTIPGLTYTDLEIAGTGAAKPLGGDVTVNGTLTLTNTLVRLSNYNLTIGNSGNLSGGSATSYFIANNTGTLRMNNIGAGGRTTTVVFPIGPSNTSYTPLTLSNTGTPDQFGVRASLGVNAAYDASDNPTGTAQTSFNVNETWYVYEAVAGGSTVTLTFQWNGTDEQAAFDRTHCFAGHYTGGTWVHGPLNQVASGSNPYTLSLSNVTSFSPFAVGSPGSILPVHLITFEGRRGNNGINLGWTAADEQNLAAYVIEKATDGSHFAQVGEVAARNQPGVKTYTYFDPNNDQHTAFYRLKQTDIDGHFTYSSIVQIAGVASEASLAVYPNPVTDKASLQLNLPGAARLSFRLIHSSGKILKQWESLAPAGESYKTLDLHAYQRGIYYLQVKGDNYKKEIKISKQ